MGGSSEIRDSIPISIDPIGPVMMMNVVKLYIIILYNIMP